MFQMPGCVCLEIAASANPWEISCGENLVEFLNLNGWSINQQDTACLSTHGTPCLFCPNLFQAPDVLPISCHPPSLGVLLSQRHC